MARRKSPFTPEELEARRTQARSFEASCALDGYTPTEENRDSLRPVIDGELDADEAREALIRVVDGRSPLHAIQKVAWEEQKRLTAGPLQTNNLPATLDEAITQICAAFPGPELAAWAALPEGQALLEAHFGLGSWVRNRWCRGEGAPLFRELKARRAFLHPDQFSDLVHTALWRALNSRQA